LTAEDGQEEEEMTVKGNIPEVKSCTAKRGVLLTFTEGFIGIGIKER
jgi:hypothetical protein